MNVLVIDDESLVRRSLKRAFEARGHTVDIAEDGEQGVEVWMNTEPDVVLLDVLMPKMTGPQVLMKMGDSKKGRIILMSAYSGEDHFEMGEGIGVEKFISKPFQDIFEVVKTAEAMVQGGIK